MKDQVLEIRRSEVKGHRENFLDGLADERDSNWNDCDEA
jgi:hypothetical protein